MCEFRITSNIIKNEIAGIYYSLYCLCYCRWLSCLVFFPFFFIFLLLLSFKFFLDLSCVFFVLYHHFHFHGNISCTFTLVMFWVLVGVAVGFLLFFYSFGIDFHANMRNQLVWNANDMVKSRSLVTLTVSEKIKHPNITFRHS